MSKTKLTIVTPGNVLPKQLSFAETMQKEADRVSRSYGVSVTNVRFTKKRTNAKSPVVVIDGEGHAYDNDLRHKHFESVLFFKVAGYQYSYSLKSIEFAA